MHNKELAKTSLWSLFYGFFKVGATGFGGPLVTMNLMREYFVTKNKWLTEKEFLERMALIKLLPGPVSSLMAIALGRKFFGLVGSFVALLAYIAPAFFIIMLWNLLEGPAQGLVDPLWADTFIWFFRFYIVYMILKASYKLLSDAWKNFPTSQKWKSILFVSISGLAFLLSYFERMEVEILAFSVVLALVVHMLIPARDRFYSFTAVGVFLMFFSASLIVFGTGYMLFPYINRELVSTGLLTQEAFDKGILLGNLSPGPVVIGATYYGWKLAGFWGAVGASFGVFAGPFLLMNILYKGLEKLRERALVQYLSLCMVPAVVVVLLKFNWSLVLTQVNEALRLLSIVNVL